MAKSKKTTSKKDKERKKSDKAGRKTKKSKKASVDFALPLAELRRALGIQQKEFKGFKQTSVSKIESRKDLKLSTLIQYLDSLKLDLEVRAVRREQETTGEETFLLISTKKKPKN